jgi:pimeloyl-ACP methyl ester carboxylesterase
MRRTSQALATSLLALVLSAGLAPARAQEPTHDFFTTSDGVRIHYMTLGEEGSWVVLIHGYTDSAERMWVRTGIAQALAPNHRVVALDNRNHGQSDEPEPNGSGRAEDVLELMDHLGIERAHIHGYSMGGGMTGQLLASHPERFITAGFGGSGIRENDPELAEMAESLDPDAPEPEGAAAAAFARLRERAASRNASREDRSATPPSRPALTYDDVAHAVPVIAINGEYDRPYSKTQRILREFETFENVVLPGLNHMTAIMVGGPMPQKYVDSIVTFINTYDGAW